MKILIIFLILLVWINELNAGSWCKAIYNKDISDGEIKKQIKKCRNSDNFFLAIHSYYQNSGHLVNSFIAEYRISWLLGASIAVINNYLGTKYFVFNENI